MIKSNMYKAGIILSQLFIVLSVSNAAPRVTDYYAPIVPGMNIVQKVAIKTYCSLSGNILFWMDNKKCYVAAPSATKEIITQIQNNVGTSTVVERVVNNVPTTINRYVYVSTPGPKGDTGAAGKDGLNAAGGPFTTVPYTVYQYVPVSNGGSGSTGPQGPAGPAGASGPIGLTGATGTPGMQGATGTDYAFDVNDIMNNLTVSTSSATITYAFKDSPTFNTTTLTSLYGAGLSNCNGSNDKIVYSSTTGQFSCGSDLTSTSSTPITNSIVSASNTLTSNVSGIISTTTLINSNTATSSGNFFSTMVNGVASSLASIINSFSQVLSGNTLTTTINGVTATSSVIASNVINYSTSTSELVSSVNGVVSTTTLSGLTGPQGPQGPIGLTGATGTQGIAGPQGLQGATGTNGTTTIITTIDPVVNTLTSNNNTMTSVVNGVTSSAPIINTNVATSSGNILTTTINGLTSSPVNIINSNNISFSTSTGILSSIINGITSTTTLSEILCNSILSGIVSFCNGGNTTGSSMTLGTNDAQNLTFETNNVERARIDNTTGSLLVGTTVATAGKVATFNGDIKVSGVVDPTKLQFSDPGALYSSFNPSTNNEYQIDFAGRNLNVFGNTTTRSTPSLYLNQNGNANIGSLTSSIVASVTSGSSVAAQTAKLSVIGGDASINGVTVGLGGGQITTNTATGYQTLYNNTTGDRNTANGWSALYSNTTGVGNTGIGRGSLTLNTVGSFNTSVGNLTLNSNITGDWNTAIGGSSMRYNTTGFNNVAVGGSSMQYNSTGYDNVAVGVTALFDNTAGIGNVAVGRGVMSSSTSGINNSSFGYNSMRQFVTGDLNTSLGSNAGSALTLGSNNLFLGANTDPANTTGSYQMNIANNIFGINLTGNVSAPAGNIGIGTSTPLNTLTVYSSTANTSGLRLERLTSLSGASTGTTQFLTVDENGDVVLATSTGGGASLCTPTGSGTQNTCYGTGVLQANNAGDYNTGFGYNTLLSNFDGSQNTGFGFEALMSNTDAGGNTAFGMRALRSNTTGQENSAFGDYALWTNTTGQENVAVGHSTLRANTTGSYNSALGNFALDNNTIGSQNTATGYFALTNNTTGRRNVANGYNALYQMFSGDDNVAIGYNAGSNLLGGNVSNIAIGANTDLPDIAGSYQLNIANLIFATNTSGTVSAPVGYVGIGTSTPLNTLTVYSSTANTSGLRLERLTSLSPSATNTSRFLTVDENGDVILSDSSASGSPAWLLGGNGGTASSSNFIGTTDAMDLSFRVNNLERFRIDDALYGVLLGDNNNVTIDHGFAIGRNNNTLYGTPNDYFNGSFTFGEGNTTNDQAQMAIGYNLNNTGTEGTIDIGMADSSKMTISHYYTTIRGTPNGGYSGGESGLILAAINSSSTAETSNGKVLTVDANGHVILVSDLGGCTPSGSGAQNTCYGANALQLQTTGNANTALGNSAMHDNQNGYENTAVGNSAMYFNVDGYNNVALGASALNDNISGSANVAVGHSALYLNTTGINNTAVGYQALNQNTDNSNTAVGYFSLRGNTTGGRNSAFGESALNSNFTGGDNVAMGQSSSFSNTSGNSNVSIGNNSLYQVDGGSSNTAIGSNSGYNLIGTASNNLALGANTDLASSTDSHQLNIANNIFGTGLTGTVGSPAGYIGIGTAAPGNTLEVKSVSAGTSGLRFTNLLSTTAASTGTDKFLTVDSNGDVVLATSTSQPCTSTGSGTNNTCYGINALQNNTTGFNNVANGRNSLFSNSTGYDNTANGRDSLFSNSTGYDNTANGMSALYSNTTGSGNTANGMSALLFNDTGNNNTANGLNALSSNTAGNNNVANGLNALSSNTTGSNNTSNGSWSLSSNITGSNNVANGANALSSNTTGGYNTASGEEALYNHDTGSSNVGLGYKAGFNHLNGDNNLALGSNTDFASTTGSNQLNIANNIFGTGLTGTVGSPAGYIGIGTSTPGLKLHVLDTASNNVAKFEGIAGAQCTVVAGTGWSCTSDERLKDNITDYNDAEMLSKIIQLRTVNYNWKNGDGYKQYGVLAQNVETIFPTLVMTDVSTGNKAVRYGEFTPILISAVKELNRRLDLLASSTASTTLSLNISSDLNFNNFAINNVKSITSASGDWSIDERGRVVAKELCLEDICINRDELLEIKSKNVNSDPIIPETSTSTGTTTESDSGTGTTTIETITTDSNVSTTTETTDSGDGSGTSTEPII